MEQFKTGKISTNNISDEYGCNFAYIEKGEGELVLCLHGFPDHALSFHNQLNFFAKKGYRVVAPYMRGYLPTMIPEKGSYQTAILGMDVIGLIEAFGYDRAILIGHDWGAAAAHAAAIIAPEKIKKIITCGSPYGTFRKALLTNNHQQKRSWYMFFFQTMIAEHALPLNDFVFIDILWKDWSYNIPEKELASVKETFRKPGVVKEAISYYRDLFNTSNHVSSLAGLQQRIGTEKIQIPLLYIHGKEDGCIGAELCDGMDDFFTGKLNRVIIPEAGHFVHLEKPEEFNKIVYEYIKS